MKTLYLLKGQQHPGSCDLRSELAVCDCWGCLDPCGQDIAQGRVPQQVKDYMEAIGMYLRSICDLEHTLEAYAFLANVAQEVFLGGAAHITQCSDVLLTEAHLCSSHQHVACSQS